MLTAETIAVLRPWCRERKGEPEDPLFPTRRGGPLTPKAIAGCSTSTPRPQPHAAHHWQQARHTPHAAPLCGRLGYVARQGCFAAGGVVRAGSGHITRGVCGSTRGGLIRVSGRGSRLSPGRGTRLLVSRAGAVC